MIMAAESYSRHKKRAAERSRKLSRLGQDIGFIPPVANPARRAAAEASLQVFCETYGAQTFTFDWSDDHLRALDKIERTLRAGGFMSLAMPRGSGKTSIIGYAAIWAILIGLHDYILLMGATGKNAQGLIRDIKAILSTNDLLAADFPEACYPIRALEGESRLARGQRHHGKKTGIEWATKHIVLPDIPGSRAAQAIVETATLGGAFRGAKFVRNDGSTRRPSCVIPDDPQTKQSAHSAHQTQRRLETLTGDIAGLPGPGERFSLIVPCTIIAAGDLSDQITDPELFPEFGGERTKMVHRFPDDDDVVEHWEQYAALWEREVKTAKTHIEATEYYRRNRVVMDRGFEVAWEDRYTRETELSAQQHAWNKRLLMRGQFEPEYQNEPPTPTGETSERLTAKVLSGRIVPGLKRWVVPEKAQTLTAFIDVQGKVLYWKVMAWWPGLGGHVVAYGAFPDQKQAYFTKRNARRTYAMLLKGTGFKAQLYNALELCCDELLGREYVREDGSAMKISLCMVDSGWGDSSDTVYRFCRESKWAHVLEPSKGIGLGPLDTPIPDRAKKPGVQVGHHWYRQKAERRASVHTLYDTNRWKSLSAQRLRTPTGADTAITLHAKERQYDHKLLFDHLTAERNSIETKRGLSLEVWDLPPGRENDWWDGLIGCAVGASRMGIVTEDHAVRVTKKRRRGKTKVRT